MSELLTSYRYELPESLIAKTPAKTRDAARLFVYDTKKNEIHFDVFRNLAAYLPSDSLLILNDTKVIPARLTVFKETGGKVELLLLVDEYKKGDTKLRGYADRKIEPGDRLEVTKDIFLTITGQENQIFTFIPNVSLSKFLEILQRRGVMPVPKYIKKTPLSPQELRREYQTIFAKNPGSIAAPTASLHFTERVFKALRSKRIEKDFITLNVGRGTFAPVTSENVEKGKLHRERYEITEKTARTIKEAKEAGRKVVAVGTTTVRCLEAGAPHISTGRGSMDSTDIFIRPPYQFNVVDALITNFHLPNSSLCMLVDTFLKDKEAKKRLPELYAIAIQERFRFYSFGDAMLII